MHGDDQLPLLRLRRALYILNSAIVHYDA